MLIEFQQFLIHLNIVVFEAVSQGKLNPYNVSSIFFKIICTSICEQQYKPKARPIRLYVKLQTFVEEIIVI